MTRHRKLPELDEGTRIQYRDNNEATRAGKILRRSGNTLTVCIGTKYNPRLSKKYRIPIENVLGYWKGRGSARPESMIKIEG